jgi:hypothetical protein
MTPTPYSEKLKDPRWQRKRLEVFSHADFQCQLCGEGKKTLHVHHSRYDGREPWEYPLGMLICLCEDCHKQHHKKPVPLANSDDGWPTQKAFSTTGEVYRPKEKPFFLPWTNVARSYEDSMKFQWIAKGRFCITSINREKGRMDMLVVFPHECAEVLKSNIGEAGRKDAEAKVSCATNVKTNLEFNLVQQCAPSEL